MAATLGEFFAFGQELFVARRIQPTADIASLLANADIDGEPVPFRDFIGNLILVLVGGNETTRNSLSHSVAAFSAHPDQWNAIRADREVLKTAAPEMVRFASPVMHMRRTAMQDTVIGGRRIAKGEKVAMWYISANRDERVFPDADRFDVRRKGAQHVGFGAGQHV
ncbi:cytochrome P450 [Sphingomonas sp. NPDC079357]|uniref:cytochrome P450 n=1 Tax=Sphingomonas sp. NPDC079357 TaxID=3364518 RepID=UPI00384E642A